MVLRNEAGYALEELADKIGLRSRKFLGQIECGETNIVIDRASMAT
jgi:transcriptional regulator with XRE-family HTH domain